MKKTGPIEARHLYSRQTATRPVTNQVKNLLKPAASGIRDPDCTSMPYAPGATDLRLCALTLASAT